MKYGWDDEFKEADLREWREWYREAKKLDEVRIPRTPLKEQKLIRETALHVFCDASQDVYGAYAYLRRAFTDDAVQCSLSTGKGQFKENTTRCLSKCFYNNVRKK